MGAFKKKKGNTSHHSTIAFGPGRKEKGKDIKKELTYMQAPRRMKRRESKVNGTLGTGLQGGLRSYRPKKRLGGTVVPAVLISPTTQGKGGRTARGMKKECLPACVKEKKEGDWREGAP